MKCSNRDSIALEGMENDPDSAIPPDKWVLPIPNQGRVVINAIFLDKAIIYCLYHTWGGGLINPPKFHLD